MHMVMCNLCERTFFIEIKSANFNKDAKKIRDAITPPCRFNYIGGSDGFTILAMAVFADQPDK